MMITLPFNHVYLYVYLGIGATCSCYFVIKALIEYLNLSSYRKHFQKPQSFKTQLLELLQHMLVYSVASILCTFAWPVILIWGGIQKIQEREARTKELKPQFYCKEEHLIKKVTLEESEQSSYVLDPLGMAPKVAFGHLNKAWCSFLAELEDGDEIWLFVIPNGSLTGKDNWAKNPISGYAQVRRQKIIAEFVYSSS